MLRKFIRCLNCFYRNLLSLILGIIYRRDKRVILIGSWMGEKFSDNSRYLFQYLDNKKVQLGLVSVIWATRNSDLYKQLNEMGYKACLIGTKESKYWHLKAGVHIVCNMAFKLQRFQPDIDTKYSYGAKKIQLWHGIPMKSVGFTSNDYKTHQTSSFFYKLFHLPIFSLFHSLGAWENAFVLTSSISNALVMQEILKCSSDRTIISGYPRNCECIKLLPNEEDVIKKIRSYKVSILYLPTFRDPSSSSFKSPILYPMMTEYLKSNNILWIEKPHSADTQFKSVDNQIRNVLTLDSQFDINTLLSEVTIIMSDYSSVVFDAVYRNTPVVMYTPDIEEFKGGNVGFLFDIRKVCNGLLAYTIPECIQMCDLILSNTYFTDEINNTYANINKEFWGNSKPSYEEIWEKLK